MLSTINRAFATCLRYGAQLFLQREIQFLHTCLSNALNKNHTCLNGPLSDCLLNILLIAEDKRFWHHGGIDVVAILRAVYSIIIRRQIQGASTIEQQLTRTLTGYRDFSIRRKLREILLACVVGVFLSKREIAALYLCCAYYGWRMNSLEQACSRLGILASSMNPEQSAQLVTRLRYPEPRTPSITWQRLATARASYILRKFKLGMSV